MVSAPVTVVVATYNRPEVLAVALRSALHQQPPPAEVLVVGDNCDPRTADVCASLGDERVRYLNLPQRFGEQSGPNSVGMLLARTEYVALLNQDDLWLPGHLVAAVASLAAGSDLFLGRAATATTVDGASRPRFGWIHPEIRRPSDGFRDFPMIEPASGWVFRRELVEQIGPWRSARGLQRPPIQDWFLRAWRAGIRIDFARETTVVRVATHREPGPVPEYQQPSPEHEALEHWIEAVGPTRARAVMVDEAARSRPPRRGLRATVKRGIRATVENRIAAAFYRTTGVDARAVAQRVIRRPAGHMLDLASQRRTGTPLPPAPDLAEVVRGLARDRG